MKPCFPFGICICNNPLRQSQPRNTETVLFTWMSPFLPMAGDMFPGTPLKLSNALVPLQVRTMLPPLHFLGFLWSCYTSEVSPDNFSNRGGVQQRVLLGSVTLSQCKTLVHTKWLNSHVKRSADQSLPESIASWPQTGSKGKEMMVSNSLFLEDTVSGECR